MNAQIQYRITAAMQQALLMQGITLPVHMLHLCSVAVEKELSDELEAAWQYDDLANS